MDASTTPTTPAVTIITTVELDLRLGTAVPERYHLEVTASDAFPTAISLVHDGPSPEDVLHLTTVDDARALITALQATVKAAVSR